MNEKVETELLNMIQSKNWTNLINFCEMVELDANVSDLKLSFNFYAAQLFAYYILDDIENAKCFWKRISPNTKKTWSTELGQIWEIGKSIWQNDHVQVYQLLSTHYPGELMPLCQALQDAYRVRMFNLVSNAYDNIYLKDLSQFLGMNEEAAKKYVEGKHWKFDSTTQSFTPVPIVQKKKDKAKSTSEVLSSLSDRALFLELN